jgi:hypothetical protein
VQGAHNEPALEERAAPDAMYGARPEAESAARPDLMLIGACRLLRESGRHAATAAVILLVVSVGVVSRLTGGGPLGGVLVVILVPMGGSCLVSAGLAVRSHRTLLAALARARSRTGAPIDSGVPWTPSGAYAPLDREIVAGELRLLLGAAHRCCELASRAGMWAVATLLLFGFWLLAGIG